MRHQYDLWSVALALEENGAHARLTKKIRQVVSVASAHNDLIQARDALDALSALMAQQSQAAELGTTVSAALFAHSVILYARATETKPIDRWNWFGKGILSGELASWHEEVMNYRNWVVAHFGHGDHQDNGPSVVHSLGMSEPARGSRNIEMIYIQTRAQTRSTIVQKLKALVPKLIEISVDRYQTRCNELHDELAEAVRADRSLPQLIKAHPLNLTNNSNHKHPIDLTKAKWSFVIDTNQGSAA